MIIVNILDNSNNNNKDKGSCTTPPGGAAGSRAERAPRGARAASA